MASPLADVSGARTEAEVEMFLSCGRILLRLLQRKLSGHTRLVTR